MRLRTVLLVLTAVAVSVFALLNWEEFMRDSTLRLGWQTVTAPLGAIMLALLGLAALVFIATSVATHTRHMMESRQHQRTLQAQRELAERAEASRFTDLRTQLDTHLRESRQREMQAASEMEQTVARIQRELRNQLEQLQRALGMRLGEMEARLERPALAPAAASQESLGRSRIARNPQYLRDPQQEAPIGGGTSRAQRLGGDPALRGEEPPDGAPQPAQETTTVEQPPVDRLR